ncbi:MAG: hypothetical protein RL497_1453, partial [Pseudomonadota bacterium]
AYLKLIGFFVWTFGSTLFFVWRLYFKGFTVLPQFFGEIFGLAWGGLTLGTASWLGQFNTCYGLPWCQQLLARWAADANTGYAPEPGVELTQLDKIIRKLLSSSDKNKALASAIVQWHVERYCERHEKKYSTHELPEEDAAANQHILTVQNVLALCQLTQLTQLHERVLNGVQQALIILARPI